QVYRFALAGPESCTAVITGERSCLPLDMHEQQLLFAVSTLGNPDDLFTAAPDGSAERQLTHLNASFLSERALPAVEHLSYPSPDGTRLDGCPMQPSFGQPPYPTALYTHGAPHTGFGHECSFDFLM